MTTAKQVRESKFQAIWDEADKAGKASAEKAIPTPMIVGTPTTPLGSDIDYTKKTYFVAGGVCGFAEINFAGNTSFGRWAKNAGLASKNYYGGLYVWVSDYGQSMEIKQAYARAFAQVLRDNGIDATSSSRMD